MVAAFLESESGASLETGGAHWFATQGVQGDAEDEDASHVDGTLKLEVRGNLERVISQGSWF